MAHEPIDSQVHHAVLAGIVETGHAPRAGEIAEALSAGAAEVEASLRRLEEGHGLVLRPGTHEVAIAHPFSLTPTATWVDGGRGGWWAPCLWCGLGIAALVGDSTLSFRIAGEAEPASVAVRDGAVEGGALLVHFVIPPRDAWQEVQRFCATVLAFRDEPAIDRWSSRHALPRGAAVPLATVNELARRWYGRHLDRDWRKWTPEEAQAIFAAVGLVGDFWEIPTGEARF